MVLTMGFCIITIEKTTHGFLYNFPVLTNEDEILNEIETFYKQLYNSGLDKNDLFDLFVQSLKTPKLQDQQRNELEGEITLAECKVVLRTFSSGKALGEDGFTWEFITVSLIY